MDVTMGKKTVVCYNKVFEYSELCENAVESVVPDTMPDIERILCADGTLVIRSKEVSEGAVSGTAGVSAAVLYVPEGENRVCCLKAAVPFSFSADAPGVSSDSVPVATLTLNSIEARMLNPRKIVIRAEIQVTITCYNRASAEYYCELSADDAAGVELLKDNRMMSHITCVKEKTFVVSDELRLPAGKPPIGELLKDKISLIIDDMRTVGSKVVINGIAKIGLTYVIAESNDIACVEFETTFSQLIEADGELALPECRADLLLTAVFIEPHTYAGGEPGFTCELHIVAQMVCFDSLPVDYISDCYSNSRQIEASSESVKVICDVVKNQVRCNFHEQLDMPQRITEIVAASCQTAEYSIEDGAVICKLTVSIIFTDENGGMFCVTRRFPLTCSAEMDNGMTGIIISAKCEQLYATPAQNSIEMRTQVCFELLQWREFRLSQVSGITILDEPEERKNRPSLVVVRAGCEVSVWSLAKRYCSTCELIMTANGLTEDDEIAGKILLIPKAK